jgi:hypothetical protein
VETERISLELGVPMRCHDWTITRVAIGMNRGITKGPDVAL